MREKMKSLSEIQKELRAFSEQAASLIQELEGHKSKSATNTAVDYEKLMRLASRYPIENKKLRAEDLATKQAYFRLLSSITAAGDPCNEESLLFLMRLAVGVKYKLEPEELIKQGLLAEGTSMEKLLDSASRHNHSLLLDGLLAANLTGTAAPEQLELIAELAYALSIERDDLALLARLAKCLIQQDEEEFGELSSPDEKKWKGKFNHHIPDLWLINSKKLCGDYSIRRQIIRNARSDFTVTYQRDKGAFVRSREKIVEYKDQNGKVYTINAVKDGFVNYETVNGTAGQWRIEKRTVYVTSCFGDPNYHANGNKAKEPQT